MIDTNIAIHLRDGDDRIVARVASLTAPPTISVVTQVELEGGVVVKPALATIRRATLDALMEDMLVHPFGSLELAAYRRIVETAGYSRPRILDRMIAATAMVHDLTLITLNGDGFRDVAGLDLEVWT